MTDVKLVDILLVEDNDLDAELTLVAAEEYQLANRITRLIDGQQALDYLQQRPPFDSASRPDLILLDLNLPGIDGREVLKAVKTDVNLQTIPVIVLTTSVADQDVLDAYHSGSNAYIQKPVQPDGFMDVIRTLEAFWFGIVILPRNVEGMS